MGNRPTPHWVAAAAFLAATAIGLTSCSQPIAPDASGRVSLVLRAAILAPAFSMTHSASGSRTLQASVAASSGAATASCGPFLAAGVTISEISLQGDGGSTVLRSTPATVDLCTLASQTLALVNDVMVPAGSYSQLRLVISGGYLQDAADGNVYASPGYALPPGLPAPSGSLQMPSYGSSGLKVDFDGGGVTIGSEQKVWALDFSVEQSFGKAAGASGQWVMSPVIKESDLSFTGSVRARLKLDDGVTLPSVGGTQITFADFSASADDGTHSVTQTFDATSGETTFYLVPSSTPYTIALLAPSTLDVTVTPASPPTVTIAQGLDAAPVVFTLTSVSLKP